jgi:type II secretory ATPase GspE/PulE/Tfp pilus assembly ATPase PilB-like protein
MTRIKVMANLDTVRAQLPVNGKLERLINDRAYDVRVNVCPTELGGDIALRLLPRAQDIPSFGDLGIPEREQAIFREVIGADNGLCLITGPTGAGKSTTLYAVMGVIDRFTWRVLSGEDPVEILVPQVEQTEIKPPMTPKIYAENMLRRDPDYLIFSEVRDRDTAGILVGASMTGHVVFSTLHCNSCMEAGLRMIDLAVDPFLLAESLKACFAQRLVRRVCDHCAGQDRVPDGEYLERAGLDASWFGTNPRFRRGQGCKACGLTGYRGRTCVIEGYLVDDDIRRQILGGHPDPRRIEERMRADGGRTIVENACALAGKGLTTLEEVLSIKAIRF